MSSEDDKRLGPAEATPVDWLELCHCGHIRGDHRQRANACIHNAACGCYEFFVEAPPLPQRQAWHAFVECFKRCWCGSAREGTAGWAIEHVRCIPDLPCRESPQTTSQTILNTLKDGDG